MVYMRVRMIIEDDKNRVKKKILACITAVVNEVLDYPKISKGHMFQFLLIYFRWHLLSPN